ncbi:hypothetical protein BC936DRAFT_137665 [Jimgerdemannia flammicorona]|uniref:Uncharacterized protein n=1 Tax=Jimgerdemannia flammicorona TaxID=994334 RepID=A0A433DIX2_9FUNG|nr:hypothetical protein BC936DRAFT_137665 [Jimgerdemannia flammicorona]
MWHRSQKPKEKDSEGEKSGNNDNTLDAPDVYFGNLSGDDNIGPVSVDDQHRPTGQGHRHDTDKGGVAAGANADEQKHIDHAHEGNKRHVAVPVANSVEHNSPNGVYVHSYWIYNPIVIFTGGNCSTWSGHNPIGTANSACGSSTTISSSNDTSGSAYTTNASACVSAAPVLPSAHSSHNAGSSCSSG